MTAVQQSLPFEAEPLSQTREVRPAPSESRLSLRARFELFHRHNPEVYLRLVGMARELQRQGWERAGMKMLFERLRWQFALQTQGDSYRLNNNLTSFYAREVMANEPDLRGFFETRGER